MTLAPLTLALILFAVTLNTAAQILIKKGMVEIGEFEFSAGNFLPILGQILHSPFLLGGITIYVFSLGAWLLTLSRVEVSVAYPMTSLGYIFTAFVGFYYLHENMNLSKVLGIVIIMIGVFLVTRSS